MSNTDNAIRRCIVLASFVGFVVVVVVVIVVDVSISQVATNIIAILIDAPIDVVVSIVDVIDEIEIGTSIVTLILNVVATVGRVLFLVAPRHRKYMYQVCCWSIARSTVKSTCIIPR